MGRVRLPGGRGAVGRCASEMEKRSGSPRQPLGRALPHLTLISSPCRSTLGSCPERCVAVCGWRQSRCWECRQESWDGPGEAGDGYHPHPPAALSVFWVQVFLAGLVVPLLLGAILTYTYRRHQSCKPMVPGECTCVCLHTHTPRGLELGWEHRAHSALMQRDAKRSWPRSLA